MTMETIDQIVTEMRLNAEHNHALVEVARYLNELADRIEAAHKAERNAHDKLVDALREISTHCTVKDCDNSGCCKSHKSCAVCIARVALAAAGEEESK